MTHNQIAYQANLINEAKNLEQARTNRVRENIDNWLAQIQQDKLNTEAMLEQQRINETNRHNVATERLQGFANEIASNQLLLDQRKQAETVRHNYFTEAETSRSNRRNEEITSTRDTNKNRVDQFNAGVNAINAAGNLWGKVFQAISPFSLLQ